MVNLKNAQQFFDEAVLENIENDATDVDVESESSSDEETEHVPLLEPSRKAIYNEDGLLEGLEDIAWPDNVEWIHKLTVDHVQEDKIDVNDDLSREMAFYTQALEGARQAFQKLQSMGIPFLRPPDYFAEMVKSDAHMLKIKEKLLMQKKQIEEADERKRARESKRIAKEVQAQKLKDRAKHKKEAIESVKKWRKQRQDSGFANGKDEEFDFGFDGQKGFERSKKRRPGVAPGDRSAGFGKQGGNDKNKKRDYRQSRFGHGGRKGMKKQNTAETTNDMRAFNKGKTNKRRKR